MGITFIVFIMKLFGLLLGLGYGNALEDSISYKGDQVYRFKNLSPGTIAKLKITNRLYEMDMWSPDTIDQLITGQFADIHIKAKNIRDFQLDMIESDIEYETIISDLEEDLNAQNPDFIQGRAHNLENYNDLATINQWMKDLEAENDNVKLVDFGTTGEGRSMYSLEIGTGSNIIAIDCGIHAREWISPAYCQWFIDQAISGRFAEYTNDMKSVQPVLNPDGYSYTWTNDRMWRKNRVQNQGSRCMGVDLNRNYEANWSGPDASANPCSESYYGTSEFSELESSNQRDYLDPYIKDGSMKAFLTFHSYGQYILHPYAKDYQSIPPNLNELKTVGDEMARLILNKNGKSYTVGASTEVLYAAAGGSDDWAYDAQLVAGNKAPLSYTYELRDLGRYGFSLPANQIKDNCEEVDEALDYFIKYVRDNKYPLWAISYGTL